MAYRLFFSRLLFLACCLQFLLIIPSCKKEPNLTPAPLPTNSEKILGTWTLTEILHNQNGQFVTVSQDCDLDDTWTFAKGDTLMASQNGTTCDPGSPNYFSLHYELQDNETVLYFYFGLSYLKYKIFILNDSTLVLHDPLTEDINGEVFAKITYKR